ncbi:MAG: dienelactone hydrolase family protein [Alphaproteobacteria bacterium]|nr:dienelactone hydrolase family protein [Alphaproteobacteria bacterium]
MPSRRTLLKTLAGLPLAAILSDPRLARAAAEATRLVRIKTAAGRDAAAALALPDATPASSVLLIHEWWGLNDQIKSMALEFARQGYVALAVDLFGGRVAATPDEARGLVGKVNPDEAIDTLRSWVEWLNNSNESNRRVAMVGWCFGGGWALRGSLAAPVDATVIYYGRVHLPADRLRALKGPVLGHFGSQDASITPEMVRGFERAMAEAGKPLTLHWYDAGHAFANPTGDNYDREDANLAWRRTLEFLGRELKV